MSMVPEEVSVGTAAPQATSAGGRHLAPAQCGTAPPGVSPCAPGLSLFFFFLALAA